MRRTTRGVAPLLAMSLTSDGRPIMDSLQVSSAAWSIAQTLRVGVADAKWLVGFDDAMSDVRGAFERIVIDSAGGGAADGGRGANQMSAGSGAVADAGTESRTLRVVPASSRSSWRASLPRRARKPATEPRVAGDPPPLARLATRARGRGRTSRASPMSSTTRTSSKRSTTRDRGRADHVGSPAAFAGRGDCHPGTRRAADHPSRRALDDLGGEPACALRDGRHAAEQLRRR